MRSQASKYTIIGALILVGLLSLAVQIQIDDKVTGTTTLLMLGVECFKVAIFWILIDHLITETDKKRELYSNASLRLKIGDWSSQAELNTLLESVEHKGVIAVNLSRAARFHAEAFRLVRRVVEDCSWIGCAMSGSQFEEVHFRSVYFSSVDFNRSIISDSHFTDCCFENVDLSNSVFLRCSFTNVRINGVVSDGVTFTECEGMDQLTEAVG